MAQLPEIVSKAWEDRNDVGVLTTVDEAGIPNAIYVFYMKKFGDDKFAIVDNYFSKTRTNISNGSKGSLLFITKEDKKAYQIKGGIDYHKSGEIFDDVKQWVGSKHPAVAVAVLNVETVYSGAEKLI